MKRILFTFVAGYFISRAVYRALNGSEQEGASTPEIWEEHQ
jgi:hypothetical protein